MGTIIVPMILFNACCCSSVSHVPSHTCMRVVFESRFSGHQFGAKAGAPAGVGQTEGGPHSFLLRCAYLIIFCERSV